MKAPREFLRFYLVPLALLAGLVLIAVFTATYTFTARGWNGEIVGSNWPRTLTMEFSKYLRFGNGSVNVDEAGKAALDDNCLWLQVLDHTGAEVTNYNRPPEIPDHYEPYQLLEVYQYGSGEYTVLLSTVEFEDGQYTYLLGFPMSLSKVTMYIDAARYNAGKILIISVAALTAVSVVMLTIYSYKAFQASENRRRQDQIAKEEWLANITHDLKTPLAPIRGYAELMTESGTHSAKDVRRYGQIILKNVMYTEQLVDDLKLTYQLQSNMLPIRAQSGNIVRFVKELVIDILNSPEYGGREVDFIADSEDSHGYNRYTGRYLIFILSHHRRRRDGGLCALLLSGEEYK